jgi:hypothetical protein
MKQQLWQIVARRDRRVAFVMVVGSESKKIDRCLRDFVRHLGGEIDLEISGCYPQRSVHLGSQCTPYSRGRTLDNNNKIYVRE